MELRKKIMTYIYVKNRSLHKISVDTMERFFKKSLGLKGLSISLKAMKQ